MLAWLADLEWRSRRQWAAAAGIRSDQALLHQDLDAHTRTPHAAYLIGQMPSMSGPDSFDRPLMPVEHFAGLPVHLQPGMPIVHRSSDIVRHTSV
jgi:hypothetical protein